MRNNKGRMDSLILREVTDIIHNDVKNSNLGFCTVTAVDCTPDYSYAKIYVTFLNNKSKGLEALEREDLEEYFVSNGEKKFKALQIFEWLYQKRVNNFDDVSNPKYEDLFLDICPP